MKTVFLKRRETLTVRFPVTSRHIAAGNWGKCRSCPVALGLLDIVPECYPSVSLIISLYSVEDAVLRALAPEKIASFIARGDSGEIVGPDRFEIEFVAVRDCTITYEENA